MKHYFHPYVSKCHSIGLFRKKNTEYFMHYYEIMTDIYNSDIELKNMWRRNDMEK